MSEHEQYKPEEVDLVDRAAAALRDVVVPDGPSERLLADTLSAVLAAGEGRHLGSSHNHISRRRIFTMRFMTKLAVAAVLAIVVGALVWTAEPLGGHAAFADVLDKVRQVKTVRFNVESTFTLPGRAKPMTGHVTLLIVGDRMRQELPGGGVSIIDFKNGEVLSLMPQQKRAYRMHVENAPKRAMDQNLLEQFRAMPASVGKAIGHKEIDGRTLDGYTVDENGRKMTVWADPKTHLPARIEAKLDIPMAPKSDIVMKDFEWDVPVDASAVSMDVPAGYEVKQTSFSGARPTEKELVGTLRTMATGNGGTFPDSFDFAAAGKAIRGQQQGASPKGPGPNEKMTQEAMRVVRGLAFVQKENGEDFHYAGRGAKLGQAGRAVFWYEPAGAATYHVIDADLTVHTDVKAADLPKVESQKLVAGTRSETQSSTPGSIQATKEEASSPTTK